MNTTVEQNEGHRFNTSPKKLIASGLISVALMAAGCGGPSKEELGKKIALQEETREQILRDRFHPAMASLGKKAARFAQKNRDYAFWYEPSKGQKELRLFSENSNRTINITMKKGVGNKKFRSGDVAAVLIENEEADTSIQSTSVRLETDEGETLCSDGVTASYEEFDSSEENGELIGFITASRCDIASVGLGIEEPIPSNDAADILVADMRTESQKVFDQIRRDRQ